MQNGNVVLLFIGTDLLRNSHPILQQVDYPVVQLIYLVAQFGQGQHQLLINLRIAIHDAINDLLESAGSNLLIRITQSLIGITVGLDNQAIKVQVHCLLGDII